jgi:prolyl-tRNA editing enzyme YbaK/EbsC (Cys-tRNA(Pro) deacylase)
MHPTAARLAERLQERGLQVEVRTVNDFARTAALLSPATADRVREVTGFSIGGIPPLGHDVELATTIDESLRRFDVVWAAAGTPHDVFAVGTEALIEAIPGARVTVVS